MIRSWRFNRVSITALISLLLLLLPYLLFAKTPEIELNTSAHMNSTRGGERFDFEYNTTGVLDQVATHISTAPSYLYVSATIENDSGNWLRLRNISFPAMEMNRGPDWRWFIWTGMETGGQPPGPPGSWTYSNIFPPPTDIFTYTVIPLSAYEIIIPPGEFFSVGYECALGGAGLYKIPSADTYRWNGASWNSVEDSGFTVIMQVMADYFDMSNLFVFPDGTGLFETIQDAIDMVDFGGTVNLADGVFSGPGNYQLDFKGKELTLRSVSENPKTCIIDCYDGPRGSGLGNGITIRQGEGPDTVVEGITFRNGKWESGAGIEIIDSSPTIRNCVFENGYCLGGGAIFVIFGSPLITDCEFYNGDAVFIGGGIYAVQSSLEISYCRFENNFAKEYGGAIYLDMCPDASIASCVFYSNEAFIGGGALYLSSSPATMTSSTLSENVSPEGSGIYVFGAGPVIWTSLITFGSSEGVFCPPFNDFFPDLVCCDIFGNNGGDWVGCIADQLGTDGNFNLAPRYCGELGTGILTIEEGSPCAPDGNDCGLFIGALDVDCEGTAVAATTWSSLKQLY